MWLTVNFDCCTLQVNQWLMWLEQAEEEDSEEEDD
jgi:hypothetical protein